MSRSRQGFSLMELLIIVGIIAMLMGLIAPSLNRARELARMAVCCGGLNNLGRSMGQYQADNKDSFWPCVITHYPENGRKTFFWGTDTTPVQHEYSPFLKYASAENLLCPSFVWGDYIPQANMKEPTTAYGYNSWCLDPGSYLWRFDMPIRRGIQIPNTSDLFVFADSAIGWEPWGEMILQNSTHLEPPTGPFIHQPTTHFRHLDRACAVSADGHSATYGVEQGAQITDKKYNLGFVGITNKPHYDIESN